MEGTKKGDAEHEVDSERQDVDFVAQDSVQLMSRFKKLRRVPEKFSHLSKDHNEAIAQLCEMKDAATSSTEVKEIVDEILYRVFFLLPLHAKKHAGKIFLRLPHSVFEDALQNMAVNVMMAIRKFKPRMGTKFSNYLLMYLQDGLFKAIKSSNVVCPSAARRKSMMALEMEADTDTDIDGEASQESRNSPVLLGAMSVTKGQVEFDDGSIMAVDGTYGVEHIDHADLLYEAEIMHWLRHALDPKNGILTEDESLTLRHHFGVFGCSKLRLKDIAHIRKGQGKGHAATRIFQIEKEALGKLRSFFSGVGLEYEFVR